MNPRFILAGLLCLWGASVFADPKDDVSLIYTFRKGDVVKYKMLIQTEMRTEKSASGNPGPVVATQTTGQEIVIEETVKEPDKTGGAEIELTFKSAKMESTFRSGAKREPSPPDTLKYFVGRSVSAYITADGLLTSVNAVDSLVAAAKAAAKEPGLAELIGQTYSEDFFKELIQNLHPRFPLDPGLIRQGWETNGEIFISNTPYKLEVTTRSSLARVDSGVARIDVRGSIRAVPKDEMEPINPAAPTVQVLTSGIRGDLNFSIEQGRLLGGSMMQELVLRTTMKMRPQGGRGTEFRTEVVKKSTTKTTIQQVK